MPLLLRVIPSSHPPTDDDRGPTTERAIEFADQIPEIRIGRRPDLELPLPFTVLSGVHARLVRIPGPDADGWVLEDLGSRNGTFLAGLRLPPGEQRAVVPGAHISLAHVDIVFEGSSSIGSSSEGTATIARRLVADLVAGGAEASIPTLVLVSGVAQRGVLRLEVRDRPYTVGRIESCALRLNVEEISREHAAFTRRWDGVFVSDLASKNGVRVSGMLVEQQRLRDGDLIQIGPVFLRLFDPEDRYLREFEGRAKPADGGLAKPADGGLAKPAASEPDLHPAVSEALAVDGAGAERTEVRRRPSGARLATLVAAVVLAVIAAVAVTLAFN